MIHLFINNVVQLYTTLLGFNTEIDKGFYAKT